MSSKLVCDICGTDKNVKKVGEARESMVALKGREVIVKVQLVENRPAAIPANQPQPTDSPPAPIQDICDRHVAQVLRAMANELAPRKRSVKSGVRK